MTFSTLNRPLYIGFRISVFLVISVYEGKRKKVVCLIICNLEIFSYHKPLFQCLKS